MNKVIDLILLFQDKIIKYCKHILMRRKTSNNYYFGQQASQIENKKIIRKMKEEESNASSIQENIYGRIRTLSDENSEYSDRKPTFKRRLINFSNSNKGSSESKSSKSAKILYLRNQRVKTHHLQPKYKVDKSSAVKNQKIQKHKQVKKSEIHELYRVIHYYEGQISILQSQIKSYEIAFYKISQQNDLKYQNNLATIVSLFSDLRQENQKLNGKIHRQKYEMNILSDKLLKNQIKMDILTSQRANYRLRTQQMMEKTQEYENNLKNSGNKRTQITKDEMNDEQNTVILKNREEEFQKIKQLNSVLQSQLMRKQEIIDELKKIIEGKYIGKIRQNINFWDQQYLEQKQRGQK